MSGKFRLITDGKHTYVELDGKTIGQGVDRIEVVAEAGKVSLGIRIDCLNDFRFMEDGYFDEATKEIIKSGPPVQRAAH